MNPSLLVALEGAARIEGALVFSGPCLSSRNFLYIPESNGARGFDGTVDPYGVYFLATESHGRFR